MDSRFGFENVSPSYTTHRKECVLDFAPLLAKANLAKLPIQLLKLFFFFFPRAVNHSDDKSHR